MIPNLSVTLEPGIGRVWNVVFSDGDTGRLGLEEVLHHVVDGFVTQWGVKEGQ